MADQDEIERAWRAEYVNGQAQLEKDERLGWSEQCYSAQQLRDAFEDGYRAGQAARWIPVSEGMPDEIPDGSREDESRVLFVTSGGHIMIGFWVTDDEAGPYWESWEQDDADDCPTHVEPERVTHWMPLPSPPEKSE